MPQINIIDVKCQQPTLIPREQPAIFDVDVSNNSDDYADIQLRLKVNFENSNPSENWYRLTPEVSSLIPPGSLRQFSIEIFDTPESGFVGATNITVEALSVAAPSEPSRVGITVNVQPTTRLEPVKIELITSEIEQAPDGEFKISVKLENPNQTSVDTNLKISGLNITWLENNQHILSLKLERGEQKIQDFCLKLPGYNQVVAKDYLFTVEASHATHINSEKSTASGKLLITPQGSLDLIVNPQKIQEITAKSLSRFWLANNIIYQVILANTSNVYEDVSIAEIPSGKKPECNFTVIPETTTLEPGKIKDDVELTVNTQRHWLGKPKKIERIIKAIWSKTQDLKVIDEQKIELVIKPIIPYWLQIGGIGLLLCLFWWILFKPPTKHAKAVNSVQFNGTGETIISGSDDQTIINWRVSGFNAFKFWANPKISQMGYQDKSIRSVRIKPVDNNLVAVALENGEMQVWDLLSHSKIPKYCFSATKDNRVFGLEFSRDSRYLFSGHGSGLVYQWDLQKIRNYNCGINQDSDSTKNQVQPLKINRINFGIESLKLVGEDNRNLAIAGRYNQLVIWNFDNNMIKKVTYPQGGQNNYITSLAIAESQPNLLFTSDNQGKIHVIDITDCLEGNNSTCGTIKYTWENVNNANNQQPVNAVNSLAVSDNACYLAAGTQDGKVIFWTLTQERKLVGKGKEIDHGDQISSVDIKIVGNDVLIVSGSKDSWVRLKREKRLSESGCAQQ
ncbi:hypothetical protein H6F32_09235 [Anabaena sp. FACHB-1237]|uniref:WD40 repeat domain-containing protein n=1 Tax=Anabaena sp. FACHB-1237 TaxID=2692769 RepID=UPI001680CE23|nr:hypothetical protein [Anabaena sp. FACHB-1237]MBD2137768.1 hypothetical protein [Anabaena sp. FACHB-1237]